MVPLARSGLTHNVRPQPNTLHNHLLRPLITCLFLSVSHVAASPLLKTLGVTSSREYSHLYARQEASGGEGHSTDKSQLWWKILVILVLVFISALVAGLTLGLMSLDPTDLKILKTAGSPKEKKAAERIEPIRKLGHQLLVTFLVINAVINETLPILLDDILGGGVGAILISTVLVLVFGEIIPQAVCSRYGLQIGAFFVWPVRFMVYLVWIIAWPIAKLLDWLLGEGHGVMYKKAELNELIALHAKETGGDLTTDEVTILQGTLNVHRKPVQEVMTPLDKVEMLSVNTRLSRAEMKNILLLGHSRLPVYSEERTNIIGILLVKSLILLDPNDEVPVSQVHLITNIPKVKSETGLFDMLNHFQEGASHMALVYDKESLVGIITIEDVIEEIIQEEIVDETDVFTSNEQTERVQRTMPPSMLARLRPQATRSWSMPTTGMQGASSAAGGGGVNGGVNGAAGGGTKPAPKPSGAANGGPKVLVNGQEGGHNQRKPKKFQGRAAHRTGSQESGGIRGLDRLEVKPVGGIVPESQLHSPSSPSAATGLLGLAAPAGLSEGSLSGDGAGSSLSVDSGAPMLGGHMVGEPDEGSAAPSPPKVDESKVEVIDADEIRAQLEKAEGKEDRKE
ncbi:hypothetical protein HDV00_004374 [Rhizophlyctis rosea]|nr:hypothetical protein HDV00_004374 [Rhizophlyctis rosea]